MNHGEPRLGIVKEHTGIVLHQWRLSKVDSLPQHRISQVKQPGIQQLVRELFLIGCAEEISHLQKARHADLADRCLYCDKCLEKIGTDNIVNLSLINRGFK